VLSEGSGKYNLLCSFLILRLNVNSRQGRPVCGEDNSTTAFVWPASERGLSVAAARTLRFSGTESRILPKMQWNKGHGVKLFFELQGSHEIVFFGLLRNKENVFTTM
jgi:hypothetical protein